MKQLRHLFLLTVLAAVAFSCNRDDDDPAPQVDPKVRQLSRSWRRTAITANPGIPQTDANGNPNGQVRTDFFTGEPACFTDNILRFRENLTYVWDQGATKCRPDGGQVFEAGEWFLSADENTIVLKSGSSTIIGDLAEVLNSTNIVYVPDVTVPDLENWNIVELTDTSLRVSFVIAVRNSNNQVTATYTITYTFVPA